MHLRKFDNRAACSLAHFWSRIRSRTSSARTCVRYIIYILRMWAEPPFILKFELRRAKKRHFFLVKVVQNRPQMIAFLRLLLGVFISLLPCVVNLRFIECWFYNKGLIVFIGFRFDVLFVKERGLRVKVQRRKLINSIEVPALFQVFFLNNVI